METVNFLAQLLGFSLTIVGISFLINPKHIGKIFQAMENETTVILSGIVGTILGIAMLLTYHAWDLTWKVFITIFGWAILIKGIIRLFCPSFVMKTLKKVERKTELLPFFFLVLIVFGCFLIYSGLTF